MTKRLMLVGSTLGSYTGWWLGGHAGMMTAFVLSMIGTGAGLYYGRRIGQSYE
jgi:hypothetical protein